MLRAIRLSAIAAVLFAGAASAQENERGGLGFLEQLFGGSERVAPSTGQDRAPAATPDRVPGGGQIGPGGPGGQNRVAQSGSELMMRIDRLEAQIRQLTGAVEQLQYRNQQLEGQLRSMQPGSEYRIQDGGAAPRSAPATRPAGTPPPAAQPPAATPGRRGDAFDPSLNPNAPGAPRTMGSLPGSVAQSQVYDPDDPVGAPGGRAAGAPLDLSTLAGAPPADASLSAGMAVPGGELPAQPPRHPSGTGGQVATLPPSDSPKDAYDLAYGYILRRDYALAEDGFRAFLRRYPSDRLASDAQYWLGESLFQRQRYRDAAEAYLNVSTKYETAARAPDALLRLGQALAAMGEKEAACASFGEVARKYPRASVSVKQGVDREQKRVRC